MPKFVQVQARINQNDDGLTFINLHRNQPTVTLAEVKVLEEIHGEGSVRITATNTQTVDRDFAEERARLRALYDKPANRDKAGMDPVTRLFGRQGQLPVKWDEAEIPEVKTEVGPEPAAKKPAAKKPAAPADTDKLD